MTPTIKQGTEKATSEIEKRGMARMKREWLTSRHALPKRKGDLLFGRSLCAGCVQTFRGIS